MPNQRNCSGRPRKDQTHFTEWKHSECQIYCCLCWTLDLKAFRTTWVSFSENKSVDLIVFTYNTASRHTRPVNLHPLFLKIGHPAFWKFGHPAFCKKQAEKNRVILYSKREETRLPLLFLNNNDLGFLHSVFFKKQGAQFSKSRVPDF